MSSLWCGHAVWGRCFRNCGSLPGILPQSSFGGQLMMCCRGTDRWGIVLWRIRFCEGVECWDDVMLNLIIGSRLIYFELMECKLLLKDWLVVSYNPALILSRFYRRSQCFSQSFNQLCFRDCRESIKQQSNWEHRIFLNIRDASTQQTPRKVSRFHLKLR